MTVEIAAINALCHHERFLAGCAACEFRSKAASEHLLALIDETRAHLGTSGEGE